MESEYRQTQYGVLMLAIFALSGILIGVVAWMMIAEGRLFAAVLIRRPRNRVF